MGDLYALDFDGVLCDSCGESSLSAVKAAKVRWPSLFNGVDSSTEDWIVDQMHIVRPVVETGYENVLLVRLLLETANPSIRKSSVAEGLAVGGILENWSKIKPIIMEEWDEEKDPLIDLFGKIRDDWMDNDLATWIGANRFYPGVPDALKFASSKVYIVTTKQSRFADALLQELAGVTIPQERIYGLGTGPKVEVLKQLQKMPEHQGLTLHFVEDRLATLKNVIKEPELDNWNLYLGEVLLGFSFMFLLFPTALAGYLGLAVNQIYVKQETGDITPKKKGTKQQAYPESTYFSSLTSARS